MSTCERCGKTFFVAGIDPERAEFLLARDCCESKANESVETIERWIARQMVRQMFQGRKGHGGGPATYREMRPAELEGFALLAMRYAREAIAKAKGGHAD